MGPWEMTAYYKNGENVIINGPVNLTNPDESINFTNQLALILDYHYGNERFSSNIFYKIQIIGGPYDGRIAPNMHQTNEISKKN